MYIYLIDTHNGDYEIYDQKKDRINYVRSGVLKKTLYNDKKEKNRSYEKWKRKQVDLK